MICNANNSIHGEPFLESSFLSNLVQISHFINTCWFLHIQHSRSTTFPINCSLVFSLTTVNAQSISALVSLAGSLLYFQITVFKRISFLLIFFSNLYKVAMIFYITYYRFYLLSSLENQNFIVALKAWYKTLPTPLYLCSAM